MRTYLPALVLILLCGAVLSGCLTIRACGGTELVVNGRVLDETSGSGVAGVPVFITLYSGNTRLLDSAECGASDEDGVIHFKGPFRWTQIYGPVGMLKRRLTCERENTCEITVELHHPAFKNEIRKYSDDTVYGTADNPYRVELGDVRLTRVDAEVGPKS